MKSYKIINTDIQLNGKLFPEGSTINLDDKDAQSLSNYLILLDSDNSKTLELEHKLEHKKRSK